MNYMMYPSSTATTARKVYSLKSTKSFRDDVQSSRRSLSVFSKYANESKLWSLMIWGPGWSQRRRVRFDGGRLSVR